MVRAFVSIGSNIRPAKNVRTAIRLLAQHVRVAGISTVYKTRPEERPEQNQFYNCVVEIHTDVAPRDLKFQVLRSIESQLKRQRMPDKYAPRTIDLDLILYDDLVMNDSDLILPDPDIVRRFFLAVPLAELDPDILLPGCDMFLSDFVKLHPKDGAEVLSAYTASLRQEFLPPK